MGWCSDHGLPHSALLEWSEVDRAKLVAYLMESAARCTMCGTSQWEWDEDRNAYEPAEHLCLGCRVKEEAAEDVGTHSKGKRIVLVPRRVAEARRARGNVRR